MSLLSCGCLASACSLSNLCCSCASCYVAGSNLTFEGNDFPSPTHCYLDKLSVLACMMELMAPIVVEMKC